MKTAQGQADIKRFSYDFRSRITGETSLILASDIDQEYLADARFDTEYTDRVMAAITYAYNKNGKLKSRTDAEGNTESFEYDYDGRAVKKTDTLKGSVTYRYDRNGNLVEERNARNVSTFYEYDNLNRLIRKKAPAADGSLAITLYIYDASGNLVKQIDPINYDPFMDTSMLAMSMLGISYAYDKMNRRTQTKDTNGQVLESIRYDANGNAVKTVDGLRYNGNMETSRGTSYVYDGLNRVVQATDALGNSRYYEYDILGNLTGQTDGRGNTTSWKYNPDGTLAKAVFANTGTVEYTWDLLGRKLTQKDQRGNVTAYAYNAFGRVRQEKDTYNNTVQYKYDLNGNVVSIRDKKGSVSIIKYDALNRPAEKRTPIELDGSGNFLYSIEKLSYDEAGNLKKRTLTGTKDKFDSRETVYTYYANNLTDTVTDSAGRTYKNHYDKNGNVIKVETLRETGIVDVARFEYDSMNRLTKQIRLADAQDILNAGGMANLQNLQDAEYPDKLRVITGFEYDLLGNKVKEIQPKAYEFTEEDTTNRNQYTIRYEYDDLNRLSGVIREYNGTEIAVRYWYDEEGNRTKTRNERGFETTYVYDEMNRLELSTDAMGNAYRYTYDLAGNKTSETNAKGYSMTYVYDNLNRLKTVTDPYNTVVTTNSYDANGNLTETKDAKGYATLYAYDLAGRVVKITDPEAALKNGFTESYEYSQYGEKTKITDGLGNITSYSYDKAGRLEKVTDSQQITTQYTYDKAGNKLTMTDGRGKTTRYGYGAFGLLRTMTDADDRTMSYAYDLAGNTAGITDRNDNLTLFIYDNRNMLVEKLANTGESIAYGYDATGNRTAMQDESGSYTYAYDKNNRITEIRKGSTLQLIYTYDATGNIETVTDSKGHTTAYAYDKSGRMETVTFDGKTTTYAYETNGNRKSVTYEGGVKEEYSYDRNNRLLTLTNKKPNGTVLSQYSYTYDITGRETSKTDSYGKTSYTYDRAGRITKVEAPGKTTVYAYDNAGNRLSLLETYTSNQSSGFVDGDTGEAIEYIVKTSRYFYSNTNQLLKLVEEMSDSSAKVLLEKTTDYLYDENGNQLAETTSFLRPTGGTLKKAIRGSVHGESQPTAPDALMERTNNTFDGFNRLTAVEKIEDGIRTSVEYTYNGDDLRTRKVVKSSDNSYTPETTSFLYDRQHVILETDETETVKTRYVRGINYIAQYNNGKSGSNAQELSYFLFNGHGDTVQTVTPTGDIQNQYDYDIFGNPTLTIETAACSIRYAGEYLDNETGLYYLRARYYDPYTGRFISQDSYWGEDTNPLSLNLYTYAYNNPVRFIDPTGHNAERIDQLIGYIDASKETWWMAQNNSNLTAAQKKAVQDAAHANAERFRAELAELEKGNKAVEQLVKQSGDDAVTWDDYKISKLAEKIQSKSEAIYEEQRNEARAMAERNWFQKAFGISNYDSRYDELDKVTLQELNKLYKLKAARAMAEELGRNVFEKEIQLNEDEFKIKQKPGQIVKTDFDTRDIQLNVLNGVYFERFKKDIEYHARQEYAVFDYYNYEHYKDNRYEMFGSTDEGTWADYLNQRGPVVDMSFISIAGTTWEEEGQATIRAAELGIAMYMTMVMGVDMLSMAGQTFNYYAAVFNSQGYYATMPTFDVTVSASGQAALAGSRTISISIPYVETFGLEAVLSSTINFATFSDKFTAMMADGVGSGGSGSGGMDPFGKGNKKGSNNWGNKDTLKDHYDRHGTDFGAKSEDEYTELANDFYKERNQFEIKVDSDGTMRVYDSKTNTFGSYNPDGSTKTFFKPDPIRYPGTSYFDKQPGILVKK